MSATYSPALAVQRIADGLIAKYHEHLTDVRIEYVFRDEAATRHGKQIWGRARKVSGLNAYLASIHVGVSVADGSFSVEASDSTDDETGFFVIEIAFDVWELLSKEQRVALVDHELCHCDAYIDEKTDDLKLRTPRPRGVPFDHRASRILATRRRRVRQGR